MTSHHHQVSGHKRVIAGVVMVVAAMVAPVSGAEKIITIGDSWAHLIADSGSLQLMLDTFFPGHGYTVANESFGGGTAQQHAGQLAQITSKINAHPQADVVYLSSGGNDFLAGIALGGWYLGMSGESAFFDSVGGYVQTVVDHILSIRPDIQIVIGGYDYVNAWDPDLSNGGSGTLFRANFKLGLNGTGWIFTPPTFEIGQQQSFNAALRGLEQRKQNIANASRRVHYVYNFGIVNSLYGYNGYFGTWPAGLSPSSYNDLPVTKSRLGSGGDDPIHLDATGYHVIATQAYNNFFNTAFQSGSLSLSPSTIEFGNVRVGTSVNGSTTASNTGATFTKVENLTWPTASGEFNGGGGSASPLFKDPSLGSDTASTSYGYAPTTRGTDTQNKTVTSSGGNRTLTLSGKGVGPMVGLSPAGLSFGDVPVGQSSDLSLTISNATSDPDLGNLTDLTLRSAEITGADASAFTLSGFSAGTVLGKGGSDEVTITFEPSGSGARSATLVLQTDEGASFGGSGQSYSIPLSGSGQALYNVSLSLVNGPMGTVEFDPVPDDPNAPVYVEGMSVTLTALPNDGREFAQWQILDPNHPGDANYGAVDTNATLTLLMDEDVEVVATFRCGSGMGAVLPLAVVLLGTCLMIRRRG